ncbi:MOSC domain-containing protein [Aureimonas mangrovi]|uniref:MOSC domain-containing protein n=1 Tax=Aureimonas mangrovi TaxID=2758041 RepID=UPI00163DC917|nr:MOSC domain-containing protein [Aureimonas mangrovi]
MDDATPTRHRARKILGRASALYRSRGKDFVTEAVDALELGFDGIAQDRHGGQTRLSGGREPWYRRGTEIRNERQLSLLSPAELDEIAESLGIAELRAEWIGGNMLVEGIQRMTWLPPRTLLFFEGGVTLKVDGDNAPCRLAGRSVAAHCPGEEGLDLRFVSAARHRRGLVAWVEKPGVIKRGESFEARLPEQWIYSA